MPSSESVITRMACVFCRRRKLKCSKQVPRCGSCQKFGFECEYGQVVVRRQRKSGSRSSNVQKFDTRLGRVEQLLLGKRGIVENEIPMPSILSAPGESDIVEAPLTPREIEELEHVYFTFLGPTINIVQQTRYTESLSLGSTLNPPIYLRGAIWALAASFSDTNATRREVIYQSSRNQLQHAELEDQQLDKVTFAHAQTWILIAVYELMHGYFHRSWMSTSRAVRLAQMMRLHRIDGAVHCTDVGLDLIPTPKDWTDAEERRRVFWMTFLMDRYACISMEWPTLIDERDIRTYLPASDDAFQSSVEQRSMFLSDAIMSPDHQGLSPFAKHVITVALCGSKMGDLQRFDPHAEANHRAGICLNSQRLENLLTTELSIPLPNLYLDPSIVFLHMSSASATISVHRAARSQSANDPVSAEILLQSSRQCLEAASSISELMKMTLHWDFRTFHPCTPYCIYNATVTYAEYWTITGDEGLKASLISLLDALNIFKTRFRVADILLQDIETEFPDLTRQLHNEFAGSVDLEFFNFDEIEPVISQPGSDQVMLDLLHS